MHSESLETLEEVAIEANNAGVKLRGYVSCVAGYCSDEGPIDPKQVAFFTKTLLNMGCYEVSLGDTTGVGTSTILDKLLDEIKKEIPVEKLAIHCHHNDSKHPYQALSNILTALSHGISVVDASAAGLGGSPFAEVVCGNVATEDVVCMLHWLNIETGIDLPMLVEAGDYICEAVGRENKSKVAKAFLREQLKFLNHVDHLMIRYGLHPPSFPYME